MAFISRRSASIVLIAAVILCIGSVLFSANRMLEKHDIDLTIVRGNLWSFYQTQYELARLRYSLERYDRYAGTAPTLDDLILRFDVFWSRVDLLLSEPMVDLTPPAVVDLIAHIKNELVRIDPLIIDLDPEDTETVEEIDRTLASFEEPIRKVMQDIVHLRWTEYASKRLGLDNVQWELLLSFGGVLASACMFIMLTLRETANARQMLWRARTAQDDAIRARHQLRAIVDAVPAMITLSDAGARYLFMNRFQCQFYGFEEHEVLGRRANEVGLDGTFDDLTREVIESGEEAPFVEHETVDADGQVRTLLTKQVPVEAGEEGLQVAQISLDITERKKAQRRITHLAHYDPLTDLPNRTLLRERLEQAIKRARRRDQKVAVLLVDLDRFKEVNDSLGHAVGDELLIAAGKRMRACLRTTSTLARLGGDEFAIIEPDVLEPHELARLSERLRETLAVPFGLQDHDVVISGSIGIAVYPDDADEIDTLLRHADLALYRSKEEGRGQYHFFVPEMNLAALERRALETDLRRAVAEEGFELFVQPRFGAGDRRLRGVEALLRWPHRERGWISPEIFIKLAEDTGLIIPLGDWVLDEACRIAKQWASRHRRPVPIAVNVSPAQFARDDFVRKVEHALQRHELSADLLEIEITENLLIADTGYALDVLSRLQQLGISLALDDFGKGYSSLAYLERFPLDKIKIDRGFVNNMSSQRSGRAIVATVVELSRSLGLTSVAEGVETEEQMTQLTACGCDEVQGFLLAKPQPLETFTQALIEGAFREQPAHAGTRAASDDKASSETLSIRAAAE